MVSSPNFSTVQMRVTATYTEPAGNYGQPIGSRVTTVSDTSEPFTWDCWVNPAATTLSAQRTDSLAQFTEATRDMRLLGQTFTIISNEVLSTRPNELPTIT